MAGPAGGHRRERDPHPAPDPPERLGDRRDPPLPHRPGAGARDLPVQVVSIPLGPSADDPLSTVDRLRIERTAVLEALGRRHLTPAPAGRAVPHPRGGPRVGARAAGGARGPAPGGPAAARAGTGGATDGSHHRRGGATLRDAGVPAEAARDARASRRRRGPGRSSSAGTISLWHAYATTVGADREDGGPRAGGAVRRGAVRDHGPDDGRLGGVPARGARPAARRVRPVARPFRAAGGRGGRSRDGRRPSPARATRVRVTR